jgi:hypothetical protein
MQAAALVADPAGDADVQIEVQVSVQLMALAGEACTTARRCGRDSA